MDKGESEIMLDREKIDMGRREAELRRSQYEVQQLRITKLSKSILQKTEVSSHSEEYVEYENSQGR